jgi:hypothetical protein
MRPKLRSIRPASTELAFSTVVRWEERHLPIAPVPSCRGSRVRSPGTPEGNDASHSLYFSLFAGNSNPYQRAAHRLRTRRTLWHKLRGASAAAGRYPFGTLPATRFSLSKAGELVVQKGVGALSSSQLTVRSRGNCPPPHRDILRVTGLRRRAGVMCSSQSGLQRIELAPCKRRPLPCSP